MFRLFLPAVFVIATVSPVNADLISRLGIAPSVVAAPSPAVAADDERSLPTESESDQNDATVPTSDARPFHNPYVSRCCEPFPWRAAALWSNYCAGNRGYCHASHHGGSARCHHQHRSHAKGSDK